MDNCNLKIISIDFKNCREKRQSENIDIVYQSIRDNDNKKFHQNINKKQLIRHLNKLQWSFDKYWDNLREDLDEGGRAWFAAQNLAINASRQGSKDEKIQIDTCSKLAKKFDIDIKKLNISDSIPTINGQILSRKEIKTKKIKHNLKSFDGEIRGKMKGFISSKISFGNGGHQDNVFAEQNRYGDWWILNINDKNNKLVLLIDTDKKNQITILKEKFNNVNNILVCNHIEFQQYIIDTYSMDENNCIEEKDHLEKK